MSNFLKIETAEQKSEQMLRNILGKKGGKKEILKITGSKSIDFAKGKYKHMMFMTIMKGE